MQNTPATSSTAPRIRQAVRTANAKTAPPALPRAPLLHGLNRAVLWQLAACGTGLLLSAGQVYGGAAPFGLGLLLGCGNTYAPAAALGCLAGLLLFQPLDTALKLAGACIGALTARIVGRQLGQTGFLPGAACGVGVLLLEQGLVSLVGGASPADTASLLCSAALAVLVGLGIHKLHIGTPRGACLWAAMAAACLQRAAMPGFAPGLAGAAFCILCCACAGSLEHTAVLALVLAMALTAAARALFCRAGRGCGRAGDSGLLPRRAPQRGRRICCRVCAGALAAQPDRRAHPRSCRRSRATGLSALPGAGSAGGVSAARPTGRHPKPDQRGTQTFRRGRYLIRHCRNSERCMQLPDAASRRKL
ncbi:MAG: hypothetical protein ACLVJT_09510 [Subdoligranulum sp.]